MMVNLLILAAGEGQRFKDCGYKVPKPLIDVNGKTMVERVIENLTPKCGHKVIIMPRKEWGITIDPVIGVVEVNHLTKGAACTALQAREYIDTDDPLIIASCDQLIDWNVDDFIEKSKGLDGSIVTFKSKNPSHSFCKVNDGQVVEVAEKKVISDNANVGVYYFGSGREFVTAAEKMIDTKDTFNDEYYIAPVYNYLGGAIKIYDMPEEKIHILGTPSKLREYLCSV